MKIPKCDSVISWIAKMKDYFNVPNEWLMDDDITAFEIMYLANAENHFKGYQNKLEEKLMKK